MLVYVYTFVFVFVYVHVHAEVPAFLFTDLLRADVLKSSGYPTGSHVVLLGYNPD